MILRVLQPLDQPCPVVGVQHCQPASIRGIHELNGRENLGQRLFAHRNLRHPIIAASVRPFGSPRPEGSFGHCPPLTVICVGWTTVGCSGL